MVSIPPFLFPLQPIHQQILLVTRSKYTQNHYLIPLLQQPCCKLPSFLAWTICNKLPLGPCFSTCLTTPIHTVYASLPHFLIFFNSFRLTVMLQRIQSPCTLHPDSPNINILHNHSSFIKTKKCTLMY